jgi:hypothetical protein
LKESLNEKQYRERIERIHEDAKFSSFHHNTLKHSDFIELVALGESTIPFIIQDLNTPKQTWIHILLLVEIVDDDYIEYNKNVKAGAFQDNVDYWLEWWKQKQRENKLKRILKDT